MGKIERKYRKIQRDRERDFKHLSRNPKYNPWGLLYWTAAFGVPFTNYR